MPNNTQSLIDEARAFENKGDKMETANTTPTTMKKYEPHLDELKTDVEQIARVREIVLEADTFEEMCQDFERNGVNKRMYFLQRFARAYKGE